MLLSISILLIFFLNSAKSFNYSPDVLGYNLFERYMNLNGNSNPYKLLTANFTSKGFNDNLVCIPYRDFPNHAKIMKKLLEPAIIYQAKFENESCLEFRISGFDGNYAVKYIAIDEDKNGKSWKIDSEKRVKDSINLNLYPKLRSNISNRLTLGNDPRKPFFDLFKAFLALNESSQRRNLVFPTYKISGPGGRIEVNPNTFLEHISLMRDQFKTAHFYNFVFKDNDRVDFSVKINRFNGKTSIVHYSLEKISRVWMFKEEFNDGEYLEGKHPNNTRLNILRWGPMFENF
ncbi:unnamed protein product [Caenorhabditis angaria]|uniref:Uncharacterized protein n=1 Tax=Caenorhabditis angaria TaxID=860376 RepID=A0A9P1IQM2_9PELO|nr:unnamed protein product [Caenorhabditis angaria]